ncbi:hypothetical protein [Paenibacillus sp. 481]|uniref:hypothetical protein n=1 Tax=Paenibacillus sp. 481 TaxID=2835869 RepID=UPI001E659D20|nr:hypothetical protein [Paenibacillus sp. 481]UHA71956.1 hypothetical protein KIK04_14600 [Paenibacillus sp. 481]
MMEKQQAEDRNVQSLSTYVSHTETVKLDIMHVLQQLGIGPERCPEEIRQMFPMHSAC